MMIYRLTDGNINSRGNIRKTDTSVCLMYDQIHRWGMYDQYLNQQQNRRR